MAKRNCPIDPDDFIQRPPDGPDSVRRQASLEGFYRSMGRGCIAHHLEPGSRDESGGARHFTDPGSDDSGPRHFFDGGGGAWGSDICGMY